MPEFQVLSAFLRRIKRALKRRFKKTGRWPQGYFLFFPRTWAEGTARKAHKTFSADVGDYVETLEPMPAKVCEYDDRKFPKNRPGRYVITQQLKPGPVNVAVRGKHIALSAGHHAVVCRFALEGSILVMDRRDFDELVAECVPGNNPNKNKAARLRSFLAPERFIEPGARLKEGEDFKINILAAVVMEEEVIVVMDYSRMTQIHVVSSARMFEKEDLRPGSQIWRDRLWAKWPSAPDWVFETDDALAGLDQWRDTVLQTQRRMAILDVLNQADSFASGLGQQMASDLLFECAIHPDMPSFDLCSHDGLYARFRAHIPVFMRTFVSDRYFERCGLASNSLNPFYFNDYSDNNFIRGFVKVYRKIEVRVPAALYHLYQSEGLFDSDHTIGLPYLAPCEPTTRMFKVVPVRFFEDSANNRYHIIKAMPPDSWESAHTVESPFEDVSNAGFQSTLGPASFGEPLRNTTGPGRSCSSAGRKARSPAPKRTGKPGRPKSTLTLRVKRTYRSHPALTEASHGNV
ncbi:hypothetical protein R3P38DRAFT_3496235 [Favolaschia claudopus]|uniref:Uncharacterized protein n=1 Tax=Favolaschia claudopus TaxID=2862362 RepID=A0AAV9Z4X6_9AGAR